MKGIHLTMGVNRKVPSPVTLQQERLKLEIARFAVHFDDKRNIIMQYCIFVTVAKTRGKRNGIDRLG